MRLEFRQIYLFFRGLSPKRYLARFIFCSGIVLALQTLVMASLFVHQIGPEAPISFWLDLALASAFAGAILFMFVLLLEFWPLYQSWHSNQSELQRRLDAYASDITRFKSFTEISADLVWEADIQGRLTFLGGRMLKTLKFKKHNMVGEHYLDLIKLSTRELDAINRAIMGLQPYSGLQTTFEDKDGHIYTLEISGRPYFSTDQTLLGYQGVGNDVTARIEAEQSMVNLAVRDALTGLSNRRAYGDKLEVLFSDLHVPLGLTLLALDLDGFKIVNDTHGHDIGDGLLKQVADRICGSIREEDWCARIGGDEFVVVCEGLSHPSQAEQIAARLLEAVSPAYHVDGIGLTIGASIGIAQTPIHGKTAKELMKNADLALYDAKENGRNRYCLFTASLGESLRRRKAVEQRLRLALEQRSFDIAFQPIVNLGDNRVTAFEALARWEDGELGVVSPAEFISVAEQAGLIGDLGEQILNRACLEAATWPSELDADKRVCVNVSPAQFKDERFPCIVETCLNETGLHPASLELEITENLLLSNVDATNQMLAELKSLGVSVAIDDFGAGQSSLGRLQKLSIDRLKIDRSIIESVTFNRDSRTITNAIIQLANNLKIDLVAEGIETQQQADLLRRMGCPEAQGFFFSKPIASNQIAAFLDPNVAQVA